jgi:hypothetical protein
MLLPLQLPVPGSFLERRGGSVHCHFIAFMCYLLGPQTILFQSKKLVHEFGEAHVGKVVAVRVLASSTHCCVRYAPHNILCISPL